MKEAASKFPNVTVLVNFASFRSVYETTLEAMQYPQIRVIAMIAEGVPERRARQLIAKASTTKVTLIGPATVGGIKPGCFRIGNTGTLFYSSIYVLFSSSSSLFTNCEGDFWSLSTTCLPSPSFPLINQRVSYYIYTTGGMKDNIIASRLYRPGSVAYVTRSGGMSNELNNIISQNSDGVYEGVAIGGDRFPGTTFIDHLLRYQQNPAVKMMVVLGEVGGVEEYEICRLIETKVITKPLVAWCIGMSH